jgi:hypothetical protein
LKKVEELETRDLNWMRRIRITEKRVDNDSGPGPGCQGTATDALIARIAKTMLD